MFQLILESTPGTDILALAALFIFSMVFAAVLFWAFSADKEYIDYVKYLPFESVNQDGDISHDKNQ